MGNPALADEITIQKIPYQPDSSCPHCDGWSEHWALHTEDPGEMCCAFCGEDEIDGLVADLVLEVGTSTPRFLAIFCPSCHQQTSPRATVSRIKLVLADQCDHS